MTDAPDSFSSPCSIRQMDTVSSVNSTEIRRAVSSVNVSCTWICTSSLGKKDFTREWISYSKLGRFTITSIIKSLSFLPTQMNYTSSHDRSWSLRHVLDRRAYHLAIKRVFLLPHELMQMYFHLENRFCPQTLRTGYLPRTRSLHLPRSKSILPAYVPVYG